MRVRITLVLALAFAFPLLLPPTTLVSAHSLKSLQLSEKQSGDPAAIIAGKTTLLGTQPRLLWPPDRWTLDTLTPTFRWQAEGYVQIWVAPQASSIAVVETVLNKGQDNFTIAIPLTPTTTYRWRIRSNPYPPGQSVYTWEPWTAEYTFTTPGGLSWKDIATVRLLSPSNGTLSTTITPTLSWMPPPGATHFEMIITPAGNEAASVRFVQKISSNYPIPGPPAWYGMLPDTLYYWRVRVNNAPGPVPSDHPSWGPWPEVWAFRTPIPPSEVIAAASPKSHETVNTPTPTLVWQNPNDQIFYYEIQMSKDPRFTVDPQKATAPLYWETRHGGLTTPRNSYTVPSKYPLERGQTYYWRVRPAVATASRLVAWSPTWTFTVQ